MIGLVESACKIKSNCFGTNVAKTADGRHYVSFALLYPSDFSCTSLLIKGNSLLNVIITWLRSLLLRD